MQEIIIKYMKLYNQVILEFETTSNFYIQSKRFKLKKRKTNINACWYILYLKEIRNQRKRIKYNHEGLLNTFFICANFQNIFPLLKTCKTAIV